MNFSLHKNRYQFYNKYDMRNNVAYKRYQLYQASKLPNAGNCVLWTPIVLGSCNLFSAWGLDTWKNVFISNKSFRIFSITFSRSIMLGCQTTCLGWRPRCHVIDFKLAGSWGQCKRLTWHSQFCQVTGLRFLLFLFSLQVYWTPCSSFL